jgi:NIMA (never in mitosis gene a)-related kinase
LLTKKGQVKIADLGVGRQVSQQTLMLKTFYGTPLYASPELCANQSYNEKTDIWSLGVVLYELAALTTPFGDCNSLLALSNVSFPLLIAKDLDRLF